MIIKPRGTQFVSNPFQILGVSDPVTEASAPVNDTSSIAPPLPNPAPPLVAPPAEKKSSAVGSATPSHPALTFLHELGKVLLDDVLPVVLQVGVPLIERKI